MSRMAKKNEVAENKEEGNLRNNKTLKIIREYPLLATCCSYIINIISSFNAKIF